MLRHFLNHHQNLQNLNIKNEQNSELFYVYGTPDKGTGLGLTGYASRYDYKDTQDLYDLYASGKSKTKVETVVSDLNAR